VYSCGHGRKTDKDDAVSIGLAGLDAAVSRLAQRPRSGLDTDPGKLRGPSTAGRL
jgi:hypothetical protein